MNGGCIGKVYQIDKRHIALQRLLITPLFCECRAISDQ